MENDKLVYIGLLIVVLGTMFGFYLMFDKISSLSTEVKNLELSLQLQKNTAPAVTTPPAATETPSAAPAATSTASAGITIPTAIIFDARSSPKLAPQATTTIEVESVTKLDDGTIQVAVKAFTSNASSYTAIDMSQLFAIVNLTGDNVPPASVDGLFQSMPPKSSVTGRVNFAPGTDRNTLILQVGSGDALIFYEFDFSKKTYKETVIG